nr:MULTISPECIES: hypothetical protein [Burkholderia]
MNVHDPSDLLVLLMPPFRALLERAADAQMRGERVARDIWLAAAGHLHGST